MIESTVRNPSGVLPVPYDPNLLFKPIVGGNGRSVLDIALSRLQRRTQELDQVMNSDNPLQGANPIAWLGSVKEWSGTANQVALTAFGSFNAMFVYVLTDHFPRTAAFLSLAGVITFTNGPNGEGQANFDWQQLHDFLIGASVNPTFLDALLEDVQNDPNREAAVTGNQLAAAIAMAILMPRSIVAIDSQQFRAAYLEGRHARPEHAAWGQFIDKVRNWFSLTLPLSGFDSDRNVPDRPTPANKYENYADVKPDLDLTLALRSEQVPIGDEERTLFELWLMAEHVNGGFDWDLGKGWHLTIAPNVMFGLRRTPHGDWQTAFKTYEADPNPRLPVGTQPLEVKLFKQSADDEPDFIFGPPYDSRIEIGDIELYLRLREVQPVFEMGLRLDNFVALLSPRIFRKLGIVMDSLRLDLDLEIGYRTGDNPFLLDTTLGLQTEWFLPRTWASDAFTLHSIRLNAYLDLLSPGENWAIDWGIDLRTHLSFKLGPVIGVVDGLGLHYGSDVDGKGSFSDWLHGVADQGRDFADWIQGVGNNLEDFLYESLTRAALVADEQNQAFRSLLADAIHETFNDDAVDMNLVSGYLINKIKSQLDGELEDGNLSAGDRVLYGAILNIPPLEWSYIASTFTGLVVSKLMGYLGDGVDFAMDGLDKVADVMGWVEDILLLPTGIGIGVDQWPLKGGGFVDYTGGPTNRYGGALSMTMFTQGVQVFFVSEDTSRGDRSAIMLFGAEFHGYPLGFGFFLRGLGGVLGHSRTVDKDRIRERFAIGSIGNILFNPDPIRDAPAILRDLDAFFPPRGGASVIGPTISVGWIGIGYWYLVYINGAIIFDLTPGARTTSIVFLGSGKCNISVAGVELLHIQLDMVGILEFNSERQKASLDAALIESHVLEIFNIMGDAAFRLQTGSNPHLALTVGGFFPGYEPEPDDYPLLERLALELDSPLGNTLKLRGEAYFAVTTTTIQFGYAVELVLKYGRLNVRGFKSIDVLFQVDPFYFEFRYKTGLQVRYRFVSLAGLTVSGKVWGPGPVKLQAKLKIDVMFLEFKFSKTFNLSQAARQTIRAIHNLLELVAEEIQKTQNLVVAAAKDALTQIVDALTGEDGRVVISPLGGVSWGQQRLPLNQDLDRFEGGVLDTPTRIEVTSDQLGETTQDWFAVPSFVNLDESERLNMPAFQRLQAGLKPAQFGLVESPELVPESLAPDVYRLPQGSNFPFDWRALQDHIMIAAADRHAPLKMVQADPQVSVRDETWAVVDTHTGATMANASRTTPANAFQTSRQEQRTTVVPENDRVELGAF